MDAKTISPFPTFNPLFGVSKEVKKLHKLVVKETRPCPKFECHDKTCGFIHNFHHKNPAYFQSTDLLGNIVRVLFNFASVFQLLEIPI